MRVTFSNLLKMNDLYSQEDVAPMGLVILCAPLPGACFAARRAIKIAPLRGYVCLVVPGFVCCKLEVPLGTRYLWYAVTL